jgi:PAS domain S-box-containing protein
MGRLETHDADDALVDEIAQLRETIAELRSREASFRAILENTPDQVTRYDRNLRRTYANPATARTYGLQVNDLIGKPILSIAHDAKIDLTNAQIAEVTQKIKSVFETGKSITYKIDWPSPAGVRHYSVLLFPETDSSGSVVSVTGITRDITKYKSATEKVVKQREILQKIFDHIPIMISFVDADGNLLLVNREWERWRGWTLEEIISGTVDIAEDGYPDPEYRKKVWELCGNSSGEWVDFKTRVRDGRIRDGTWAIIPLSDGTRIAIGQDITERKRAEEELRRSEAYLAEGQRLSHTGSWARNVATDETYWSRELFRMFGFDPAVTNPSLACVLERIHPDDKECVRQTIARAEREGLGYELDYRIILPDESIKHIHGVAHPAYSENGELQEYIGTVVDTTVQRQAEEERTQLLSRIITAQEEERERIARELHDEMGQYLAALNLGLRYLSAANDLPPRLKPRIAKLEGLTNEFSQRARRFALELRPTVLDDLGLQTALTNYLDDWSKRNDIKVDFHTTGPADLRLSPQTETALYRTIQEALNNVLKHSRAQMVSVIVEYSRKSVVTIIEDNGVGFDPESALSVAIESRGLGLTSMRERIESVGGTLEIESAPGNGTLVAARVPTNLVQC